MKKRWKKKEFSMHWTFFKNKNMNYHFTLKISPSFHHIMYWTIENLANFTKSILWLASWLRFGGLLKQIIIWNKFHWKDRKSCFYLISTKSIICSATILHHYYLSVIEKKSQSFTIKFDFNMWTMRCDSYKHGKGI